MPEFSRAEREFSPAELTQFIVQVGLLEPLQIEQAWSEAGRVDATCEDLIRVLLRKQLLTNLQVERVKKREVTGYFYGHYKVLYLVGEGTFARVYRGVHRETGNVAAIKVLRNRHRSDPAQVEQFLREAKVGMRLRHPNIVAIHEVDPNPRNPYMVMEFVEGETLRQMVVVRKRKIEPITALKIMSDVASALTYASTLGITHRDMKLSNVLVTSHGRGKLVDFGMAALADLSHEEALADCPNARAIDYAALERGTGVRKDDSRSDLYFLGAMLYQCLSGVAPLTETRDRLARLNVTRFREIPLLSQVAPDLPTNVAALVHKAMELDPTKRYQTAEQLNRDLQATIERLEAGDTQTTAPATANAEQSADDESSTEGNNKTVMLVESKLEFQDLIRDKLKKRGYKVLVYSDPSRALARFIPNETPAADCIIFSAPELGAIALDGFNKLLSSPHTQDIPAIMLVDRKQQFVIRGAQLGPKRMLLAMPLKVRELRTALLKLLRVDNSQPSES